MTSNSYRSNWVFTPMENTNTGIKYVRNWESDPSAEPKPCFRCYLATNLCEWCRNETATRTYCSWEQFKINANWEYFPGKKCPKSSTEFYNLFYNLPGKYGDPSQTYKDFIDSLPAGHLDYMKLPHEPYECDKDRKEYQKYKRNKDFYDPTWQQKQIELKPVPINQGKSKSSIFSIITSIILSA